MKQDLCQFPPQGVRPQPAEGVTKRLAWGEGEGKEREGGKQGARSGKILTRINSGERRDGRADHRQVMEGCEGG